MFNGFGNLYCTSRDHDRDYGKMAVKIAFLDKKSTIWFEYYKIIYIYVLLLLVNKSYQ